MIRTDDTYAIAQVTEWIRRGNLAVLPTETVYGLAGAATLEHAVHTIYQAKNRPGINPLIIHYDSWDSARQDVITTDQTNRVIAALPPGPVTLVLPRSVHCRVVPDALANQSTIAVRIPDHPFVRKLINRLGFPLAMPSANRSGKLTATTIEHAIANFATSGIDIMFVDDGQTTNGIESTIIDMCAERPCILRPGAMSRGDLKLLIPQLDPDTMIVDNKSPRSSGLLSQHYAPSYQMRMNATRLGVGETGLAFAGVPFGAVADLSAKGDVVEAAQRLYATLFDFQQRNIACLAVGPVPGHGIGRAINDRLKRACTSPK